MPSATARRSRPAHLRLVIHHEPTPRSSVPDRTVPALLFSTVALTMIGLIMVLSASSVSAYAKYGSSFLFFQRQAAYAAVGAAAMWLTARMRYWAWARLCVPLLALTVALLALVLHPSFGTVAGGSARWIEVGPVTIQPSELAKLAVLTFAATLLARRWKRLADVRSLTLPLVPVVGLVSILILLQPDMGTAVIILTSVLVLAFTAGARMKHLAVGTAALGTVGFGLMYVAGYRWARFLSFLDPWEDRLGHGWHTIQSLIALGSGGPLGVGLGASRQKWSYVPNAHTDFIFSIIGEELGVVGAVAVLLLFGLLVFAGIRIAVGAPDAFGRLLAAGITGWLGLQALVNLGAVTGLLPITGVPLPLVSFGGSSLVVSMAAIGILISIGRRASRPSARG
ncbi:MAG: putative lipid II flippase FtsW [Actinomycetota bacterium]